MPAGGLRDSERVSGLWLDSGLQVAESMIEKLQGFVRSPPEAVASEGCLATRRYSVVLEKDRNLGLHVWRIHQSRPVVAVAVAEPAMLGIEIDYEKQETRLCLPGTNFEVD